MLRLNIKSYKVVKLLIITMIILAISNLINYKVMANENKKNIVVLLDNSGSMNSSQNKIGDLAIVAGSMILDSIKEEEMNVSIITFGEKVTVLKNLSSDMKLTELKDLLKEVKFDESNTNVKDGLKVAIDELNKFSEEKNIIILSDGEEDPVGGLTDKHKNELSKLIDEAAKSNIKINTIALSDDVDYDFLSNVAANTGGLFREGKTANKLFESLTSIIGEENDFTVIENYTTDINKEKSIDLSSLGEEVIINVAACDNKKPQVSIKLNNKKIEPSKYGDMYEVYRFNINNKENSNLIIEAIGDEVSSVIVQFKSKAKIKMINNESNYISIPKKVPFDVQLYLEDSEGKLENGVFLQCSNGEIIKSSEEKGIYKHSFISDTEGENIVRYTARDSKNGIIAVLEVVVNINAYPPFYYENLQESLIQGDKLTTLIKLKDTTKVSQLSGELIIKQGEKTEEIPLEVNGDTLVGEFNVNKNENIRYYANIRGIIDESEESFAYSLPVVGLSVHDKPIVSLAYINKNNLQIVKGKESIISLNILKESVITEPTTITIFDLKKNKIGSIYVDKGTKGLIEANIMPLEKGKNIELFFETDNGIKVTESLKTNITVYSYIGMIFNRVSKVIIYFVLPLVIITLIVISLYFIFNRRYKEEVKDFNIPLNIEYTVAPNGHSDILSEFLSNDKKELYLNINKKNNHITLDEEPTNPLGCFKFNNRYESKFKVLQGVYSMVEKEKMFSAIYESYEEINDESIATKIKYEPGITIPYKMGKKKINIDF